MKFHSLFLIALLFSTSQIASTAPLLDETQNAKPLPQFSVCTHFQGGGANLALFPPMQKLGISAIRNDFLWADIEKTKGQYAFNAHYQQFIEATDKAGLGFIVLLCYENPIYKTPEDPLGLDPQAFANWARWMVHALKGKKVVAWEIMNEPNNFIMRQHYGGDEHGKNDALWVKKYAELVEVVAKAIREEDPTTPIIAGTSLPAPSVYQMQNYPASFAHVDGLVEHPYTHRLPPETSDWGGAQALARDGISVADDDHSMSSLFRHLDEASRQYIGKPLPLWLTEFGYPTFVNHASNHVFVGFTEEAQAAYLARWFVLSMSAPNVRNWSLYMLQDEGKDPTNYPQEQFQHFGVVRSRNQDYGPKPSFDALHRIALLFDGQIQPIEPPNSARLDAPPRFVPYGDTPWSQTSPEKFGLVTGPQIRWFQTPSGPVAFVWEAGRYDTETTGVLGAIKFTGQPNFAKIEAVDLQTGEEIPLQIGADGANLKVERVPVGSFPVAIRFRR